MPEPKELKVLLEKQNWQTVLELETSVSGESQPLGWKNAEKLQASVRRAISLPGGAAFECGRFLNKQR